MGLFSRLLNLHRQTVPTEDFFTEIVAHLLGHSDDLLSAWLDTLKLPFPLSYNSATVTTQKRFLMPHQAQQTRRPDIFIELHDRNYRDWILIESKLGAREGPNQLRDYALILAAEPDIRHRLLLFITRDYDPKDETNIFDQSSSEPVYLIASRWHTFYHFLKSQPSNELIQEVLRFMEEKWMTQTNQFTPTNLLTISNLADTFALMDLTLGDEVEQKFKEVLGSGSKSGLSVIQYRHVLQKFFVNQPTWYVGLGYYWRPLQFPHLLLNFGASLKLNINQPEIIVALEEISKREGWESTKSETWLSVYYGVELQTLLIGSDHVALIKDRLLIWLNMLAEIKATYPHLPW